MRVRDKSLDAAWIIMVVLLPVTSMPLVVRLVGSDTVAAPSGLFLAYLVFVWLIPCIFQGKPFPRQVLPVLGFGVISVIATSAAFFKDIPPFKEADFVSNSLQALLTLAVGLSFYFVAATWPDKKEKLLNTLRWINWSGALVLLWSLLQAVIWYRMHVYPHWMEQIQRSLSTGVLFKQRVSGFALEPSWLAHQLNMLYLPIWLASSVRRFTVHKKLRAGVIFEDLLLAGGALVLFLTFSRVGLLAFVCMLAFLLFRAVFALSEWLQYKVKRGRREQSIVHREETHQNDRGWLFWVFVVLLVFLFLALLAGLLHLLQTFDPRMADVLQFTLHYDNTILRYAEQLSIAPRLVYWQVGWRIFNDFPWLGVGLGNAGYFFPYIITPYGWNLNEVVEMMYRVSHIINIKSLWVRLLAETGIFGFSFFAAWLFMMFLSALIIEKHPSLLLRTIGLSGIFVIIGLFLEGFSIDSFALPYLWFSMGLTTAAFWQRDQITGDG